MSALANENLVRFDHTNRKWIWDISKIIKDKKFTSSVIELLMHSIEKLPQKTQELLNIASYIGSKFSLKTLSVISGNVT